MRTRKPWLLVAAIGLATTVVVPLPPNLSTFTDHACWSSPQESRQPTDKEPVSLSVSVHATDGQLVKDLTKEEFRIFEDGKEQQIDSFSRGQPEPLILGLLMQWSGQRRDTLPYSEIDPASQFFRSLIGSKDAAFAVKFSKAVELLSDFTNDPAEIERNLRRAGTGAAPYRPPALHDALVWACREKLSARNGHRVLVLVIDGRDYGSKKQLRDVIDAALRSETVIYVVGLAGANPYMNRAAVARGIELATKLAKETGGQAFAARNPGDVAAAFGQIVEELRSAYALGYYSTDAAHDGRFRKIRVETRRKGLYVLARKGYYAPQT